MKYEYGTNEMVQMQISTPQPSSANSPLSELESQNKLMSFIEFIKLIAFNHFRSMWILLIERTAPLFTLLVSLSPVKVFPLTLEYFQWVGR